MMNGRESFPHHSVPMGGAAFREISVGCASELFVATTLEHAFGRPGEPVGEGVPIHHGKEAKNVVQISIKDGTKRGKATSF